MQASDAFIAFTFGNFDSTSFNEGEDRIYRTIEGDRYTINLAPPMNDITADVTGADGSYYFGTLHKPKVFNINFAFDRLTIGGLEALKTAFDGKVMKHLCFAEEPNKYYVAKVTGQPNIKVIPFDEDGSLIYRGEGSLEFTAYWPYAKGVASPTPAFLSMNSNTNAMTSPENGNKTKSIFLEGATTTTDTITNNGDIPTFIYLSSPVPLSQIKIGDTTITGTGIRSWNSQTGIVKGSSGPIDYSGNGTYKLPVGTTNIILTHDSGNLGQEVTIKYDHWYY